MAIFDELKGECLRTVKVVFPLASWMEWRGKKKAPPCDGAL